eukprot:Clim_evm43s150 gene=Clim_evmTU43s150
MSRPALRPGKVGVLFPGLVRACVWGANTDVGKTIVSAGLMRSAVQDHGAVGRFVKPCQTGYPTDSDARLVGRISGLRSADIASESAGATGAIGEAATFWAYRDAIAPHRAAVDEDRVPSTEEIVAACQKDFGLFSEQAKTDAAQKSGQIRAFYLSETAGGPLSPGPQGFAYAHAQAQADLYRSLRLPGVLVGDPKLGGISVTLSAYEALRLRGYDVPAVVLSEDPQWGNQSAVERGVDAKDTRVFVIPSLPQKQSDPAADAALLEEYYSRSSDAFGEILSHLGQVEAEHQNYVRSMEQRARDCVWWPFTQHQTVQDVALIDGAYGDNFEITKVENGSDEIAMSNWFDGCGSWWTQGIGHGNSFMSKRLAYTLGRYGHVMFPENVYAPALDLTERLLGTVGRGWANRVYLSDNGSTAIEVGIKMAIRRRIQDEGLTMDELRQQKPYSVVGVVDSYHGDTIGAMDAASPNVFNANENWYMGKGLWFDAPQVGLKDGEWRVFQNEEMVASISEQRDAVFDSTARSADLEKYRSVVSKRLTSAEEQGIKLGALLIEPVVHGAGGMNMIDPMFQKAMIQEARHRSIPVVFDEVFVGWHRLGPRSTMTLLGEAPDIAAYAKLLTGGVMPFAVTLASERVFESFLSDNKADCLLHGHSYAGHAVGCQASISTMDLYDSLPQREVSIPALNITGQTEAKEHRDIVLDDVFAEELKREISHLPNVAKVSGLGTICAITLKTEGAGGYAAGLNASKSVIKQLKHGSSVFARPLGNVVYLMVMPTTPAVVANDLLGEIRTILKDQAAGATQFAAK